VTVYMGNPIVLRPQGRKGAKVVTFGLEA